MNNSYAPTVAQDEVRLYDCAGCGKAILAESMIGKRFYPSGAVGFIGGKVPCKHIDHARPYCKRCYAKEVGK